MLFFLDSYVAAYFWKAIAAVVDAEITKTVTEPTIRTKQARTLGARRIGDTERQKGVS